MYGQDSVIAYQDSIIHTQARACDSLQVTTQILTNAIDSFAYLTHEAIIERNNAIKNCNALLKRKQRWQVVKNYGLIILSTATVLETSYILLRK